MRQVTGGDQDGRAILEPALQPGTELHEAREWPATDAEEDAALVHHRPREGMQRNYNAVIELGLLRPGQRESRPLPIDDQRGGERHVNLRLDPDLRCPKARQVAGRVGRPTNRKRCHARRAMRRDHHRQRGIDPRQDVVELPHRNGRRADPLRLRAADFGQQDRGVGNQRAGDEAGHGFSLGPSRAPAAIG